MSVATLFLIRRTCLLGVLGSYYMGCIFVVVSCSAFPDTVEIHSQVVVLSLHDAAVGFELVADDVALGLVIFGLQPS